MAVDGGKGFVVGASRVPHVPGCGKGWDSAFGAGGRGWLVGSVRGRRSGAWVPGCWTGDLTDRFILCCVYIAYRVIIVLGVNMAAGSVGVNSFGCVAIFVVVVSRSMDVDVSGWRRGRVRGWGDRMA